MKTTHAILRDRLLAKAGLLEPPPARHTYAGLARSEWSPRFETFMRNRLIIGALRYGLLRAPGKRQYDRLAGAQKRMDQYRQTGNLEYLVDVANMMLLEFEESRHPLRHWSDMTGDHCHA